MRYIFYADIYFIQNFIMKVAVLYLALYCNKMHEKIINVQGIGRICLASFMGTFIEILGLVLGSSYSVFVIWGYFLQLPLMIRFVLRKERQKILKVILAGYFFTLLMNGVLEALWNQFKEYGSYIFCLLFSCCAVIVGVRIWKNYSKMQKGIFHVEMSYQGNVIQGEAFYDSGNRLKDPYTGKGVHIISEQLIRKTEVVGERNKSGLSKDQQESLPVYIPYQSLGNEAGMLEVYYIDNLIIEGEKGRIILQNCPVGVTKDNLFEGKKYEMILNEEVF